MKLSYGVSSFEKLRSEGYFYVDKTKYMEILENLPESCVVLLRPRRFGKTLFANMLGYYYDRLHPEKFDPLFKGTYIHDHPTPKRNSYMILKFNFSGINTETLQNANEGFMVEVRSRVNVFLGIYSHYFSTDETDRILKQAKPNDMLSDLFSSIEKKQLGKSVYVIIDEYDHFANNILSQGKEMFKDLVRTDGYVRPFYEALKKGTETVVDRMFITGVMPILLDSLTSGFNIAVNLSTDEQFNEVIGFTDEEITPVLEYLGTKGSRKEVREYYDGYRFSPNAFQTVYNSDMILYYGIRYRPENGRPENIIDINVVSDYRKIRAILSIGDKALEEEILTQIVEQNRISINQISELFILTRETEFLFDAKALVSLLFYMGYLTITEKDNLLITLQIPNMVLKSLYLDYMQYMLMKRGQVRIDGLKKDEMMRDLVDGSIDLLISLTENLLKGLSNRDYENFDEKYIKVVMLSLLSDINIYIPRSEYEVSADGYVDLYLQAAYQPEISPSYFIELKYVKARAAKSAVEKKEKEGREAMKKYLNTDIAKKVKNLHPYVLVFRKDRCVRKVRCDQN
jgi:hypothetical protein